MKKPLLAAILNALVFGVGLLYNGKRKTAGFVMILAWIVIRAGEISIYLTDLVLERWLILMGGLVIMQVAMAIDAYQEAKAINSKP